MQRAFKTIEYAGLFTRYQKLLSRYYPCQLGGRPKQEAASAGSVLWICQISANLKKQLSSDSLATHLDRLAQEGTRHWTIAVGGPDGFSKQAIEAMKPQFEWSFGPLTLPHELAAVILAEQVYRAASILNHHPYHTGHAHAGS